jgi:hypothetical protein
MTEIEWKFDTWEWIIKSLQILILIQKTIIGI